ncbi:hypothetical protein PR001_g13484 [Phytophthora rubi]|uniref:Uncharacterized protein n=1 Tax=Phytophthora rubi TaxID=129364 RepID=A0A6A3LXA8_9STRA|nr:hypothetical protein PR001_g13484 [Phytophthora rubi]
MIALLVSAIQLALRIARLLTELLVELGDLSLLRFYLMAANGSAAA